MANLLCFLMNALLDPAPDAQTCQYNPLSGLLESVQISPDVSSSSLSTMPSIFQTIQCRALIVETEGSELYSSTLCHLSIDYATCHTDKLVSQIFV